MNGKDLGTYHVRVEFEDGQGFIYQWPTGMRFTHGSGSVSPLSASVISPGWENEGDLLRSMEYIFTEGNYSCDCNRKDFLADAAQRDREDTECGDTMQLHKLTAIRPDGTEVKLNHKQ